jgi:hypothetical protein
VWGRGGAARRGQCILVASVDCRVILSGFACANSCGRGFTRESRAQPLSTGEQRARRCRRRPLHVSDGGRRVTGQVIGYGDSRYRLTDKDCNLKRPFYCAKKL